MPPTEENTGVRVGADGETVETPTEATNEVIVAQVPGDDPDKFVTLTLAHPLNEKDRIYLGLPADARTEVGQKVRVNKNGAKGIINAGYATIDPEDNTKVKAVLRGEGPDDQPVQTAQAEPTAEPDAEGLSSPLVNPPAAESTPGSGQPGQPTAGEGSVAEALSDAAASDSASTSGAKSGGAKSGGRSGGSGSQ